MKNPTYSTRGTSITELAVYAALVSVFGLIIYPFSSFATRLYATNVSTNHTHHSTRIAIARLTRDFHAAVSRPCLLDKSGNDVNPPVIADGVVRPEPGIRFQAYSGGPVRIASDVALNDTSISLNVACLDGKLAPPSVGDILIIPKFQVEERIIGVSGSGADWSVTLANGITRPIKDTATKNYAAHLTRRVAYRWQDGDLRYYDNVFGEPEKFTVVASDITTPTPFSFPLASNGLQDATTINVLLAAKDFDNSYSNRTSSRTRMLLDTSISHRYHLSSK